jgi:hypothetical protein
LSAEEFETHLARAVELDKLTRSTVPLLAWWKEHARNLAVPGTQDFVAELEHEVSASCARCRSRGRSSATDMLVRAGATAIAFEAKYTEPRYEDVDTWLAHDGSSNNRKRVLGHWCHLIERYTGVSIDKTTLGALVYQMVHRIASACSVAVSGRAEVSRVCPSCAPKRRSLLVSRHAVANHHRREAQRR